MNSFDRENLNFLLTASKKDMDEWYHYATEDDMDYAIELIRAARTELELQELELIDSEVECMTEFEFVPVQQILSKFTLQ